MCNKMLEKKGFTLMEILIVMGTIILLVGISIKVFYNQKSSATVDRDTDNTLNYLQKARNQSLSSVNNTTFGVRITSTSTSLFEGTSYSVSSARESFSFGAGTTVTTSLSGNATQLYFNRLTGEPTATGTITFLSTGGGSTQTEVIIIRATGLAEIQ